MTGERTGILICSIHTQPVIASNKTCQTGQIYGVVTWEIHLPGHTMWHLSPGSKRYQPHHTELTATHEIPDDLVCALTWQEFIIRDTLRQLPLSILQIKSGNSMVPCEHLVPMRQEVVFVAEAEGFCKIRRNLAEKRSYWFEFGDAEGNSMIKSELRCLSGRPCSINHTTDIATSLCCPVSLENGWPLVNTILAFCTYARCVLIVFILAELALFILSVSIDLRDGVAEWWRWHHVL